MRSAKQSMRWDDTIDCVADTIDLVAKAIDLVNEAIDLVAEPTERVAEPTNLVINSTTANQRPLDLADGPQQDRGLAHVEVRARGDGAQVVVDPVGVVGLQEADFEQQRLGALVQALDERGGGEVAGGGMVADGGELVAEDADGLRQVHGREGGMRGDDRGVLALHDLLARQAAEIAVCWHCTISSRVRPLSSRPKTRASVCDSTCSAATPSGVRSMGVVRPRAEVVATVRCASRSAWCSVGAKCARSTTS